MTADILGDWREEVIYPTLDNSKLCIYTTTIPTDYRIPTLMSDMQYRNAVAVQNVGYNQPTHVDYNLGYDTKSVPVPQIYTIDKNGSKNKNLDLIKKEWSIDELYSGSTVNLAINEPKALINGAPYYFDGKDNTAVPYITYDRTMVPIRFIAEAFGAQVTWVDSDRYVKIQTADTEIVMTVGSDEYTVNGEIRKTDVAPEITHADRTFVPIRVVAESMNKKVDYDNGLITISDKEISVDTANTLNIIKTVKAMQPKSDSEYVNGKKMALTQTNAVSVIASEGDAKAAYDLDYSTSWKTRGKGILLMETDKSPTSAVVIKFADGRKHKFRIYTRWGISDEDKADITNRRRLGKAD